MTPRPPSPRRSHPWLRRAVVALAAVAAAMTVTPASGAGAVPQGEEEEEEHDQLEAAIHQVEALLGSISGVEAHIAELDAEIAAITAREAEVNARLETAQTRVAEAEAQLAAAEAAQAQVEADLGRQRERLQDQAVAAYVSGDPSQLAESQVIAVLRVDEPLDVGRIRAYGSSVVQEQSSVVDTFIRAEERAVAFRNATEAQRRHLQGVRDAVQAERDALEVELQRREQLRAEAEAQRVEQQRLLVEAQVRRVQVEADIASEAAESDSIGAQIAAAQARQELALPDPSTLVWPASAGRPISSEFGMRFHPILNYYRMHKGADIGCRVGEAHLAITAGTILIASERGGYGLTVVVDHGGQLSTLYAHASKLLVQVGDQVEPGDPLSECGSTGLSTGPHLHFETRVQGAPIDPRALLGTDDDH